MASGPAAGVFSGREKTQRRTDTQGGKVQRRVTEGPAVRRGGRRLDRCCYLPRGPGSPGAEGPPGNTLLLDHQPPELWGMHVWYFKACPTRVTRCSGHAGNSLTCLIGVGGAGSWPHVSVHVSIHASTAQMLVCGPSSPRAPARNALSTKDTYSLCQFEQLHKTTAPKQHR